VIQIAQARTKPGEIISHVIVPTETVRDGDIVVTEVGNVVVGPVAICHDGRTTFEIDPAMWGDAHATTAERYVAVVAFAGGGERINQKRSRAA
jgi:hypothetical protein